MVKIRNLFEENKFQKVKDKWEYAFQFWIYALHSSIIKPLSMLPFNIVLGFDAILLLVNAILRSIYWHWIIVF